MNDITTQIRKLLRKHFDFEIVDIPHKSPLFGSPNYKPGVFVPSVSRDFDSAMSRKIYRQWERKESIVSYPTIPIGKADPVLARSVALNEATVITDTVGPRVYTELADACHGLKRDSFVMIGVHDSNKFNYHQTSDGKMFFLSSFFLCAINLRIK